MDKKDDIFRQFLYTHRLRFSELEKLTSLRSNDLAYHLKKMVEDGLLDKDDQTYSLSSSAEKMIPYFADDASPLPAVLVDIRENNKVLLVKRLKRPYEGKWTMPGGRLNLGETFQEAAVRIVKEKTFLDVEFVSVLNVANERVYEKESIKHGFVLIHVSAKPLSEIKGNENVQWFNLSDLPEDIIESDKYFLTTKETVLGNEFIVK